MEDRKWLERVSYTACETNEANTEPNKLVMYNGGNGDLYIGVCPESHKNIYNNYLRIERSGGASTRNPRLVKALTEVYHALADNDCSVYPEETFDQYCIWEEGEDNIWSSECGISIKLGESQDPISKGMNYCYNCGKKASL